MKTKISLFLALFVTLMSSSKSFAKDNEPSFDIAWPLKYGAITNQLECNIYEKTTCLDGIKLFSMQKTILAPSTGTVVFIKKTDEKGLVVVIQSNHFFTIVSHLKAIAVKKGDKVIKGQRLGVMQDNELGFELRDASGKSYDPEKFLPALSVGPKRKQQDQYHSSGRLDPRSKALYADFTDFMKLHGFPDQDIPKMYCIAIWESFLNPKAVNNNTNGTQDIGLFQINEIWEKDCNMSKNDLLDAQKNTKCALLVLNKQGINAWATWKKYARFCNMDNTTAMLMRKDSRPEI